MDLRERAAVAWPSRVWDWQATTFQDAFGRHALPFTHGLSGLEGFDRRAVVELAGRVPPSWTRPHSGRQPLVFPDKVRVADTSAAEVAHTIADGSNRLIIYYLERIEPYRTLMRHALEEITAAVGDREGGACGTSLSFFLASPGGVIQSHFDRHHLRPLLQRALRGHIRDLSQGHVACAPARRAPRPCSMQVQRSNRPSGLLARLLRRRQTLTERSGLDDRVRGPSGV